MGANVRDKKEKKTTKKETMKILTAAVLVAVLFQLCSCENAINDGEFVGLFFKCIHIYQNVKMLRVSKELSISDVYRDGRRGISISIKISNMDSS